jgi:putative ABC transport system permease protein
VVDGRPFYPGRSEVIVGRAAASSLGNLAIGQSVRWGGSTWQVVGVFQGDGGSVESEVWCDVDVLQQAFRRQNAFQTVYATLESPESIDVLRAALASDPRFEVDIRRESDYYADQSRSLTRLITTAGVFIAVLMGAGAVFSAVGTMYGSVVSRTREIATLRALGFGRTAVACSVVAEATALASTGGAIGALTRGRCSKGMRRLHAELPVDESGRVCVRGDSNARRRGPDVRRGAGNHWGDVAGVARRATADCDRAT